MRNQVKIPAASAILHNIIKMHNGDEEWLDNQPDNIDPADFVDLPMMTVITSKQTTS